MIARATSGAARSVDFDHEAADGYVSPSDVMAETAERSE
jgi:hypothetical protein